MFGKGKKKEKFNIHIARMTSYMDRALGHKYYPAACSEDIKPMIEEFYDKTVSMVDWENADESLCNDVEAIIQILHFLALNTCPYERMSKEDVEAFKKLLMELEQLLNETVMDSGKTSDRITCFLGIFQKNMASTNFSETNHENWRRGMVFQDYEDLWKIVHRINTEWVELRSRGYSYNTFYEFWRSCDSSLRNGEELSEEEKFNAFMGILDGKMKFVPAYRREYRPVGYRVVPNSSEDEIVY